MNYILDFIQQGGVIAYVLVAMNFVGYSIIVWKIISLILFNRSIRKRLPLATKDEPLFAMLYAQGKLIVGQGLVFAMRARDSRKYIAFDAGWRTLLPTLAILAVQSVVTAAQFPEWRLVSLACVALVVVLQGRRLLPILGFVKSRVKRDK